VVWLAGNHIQQYMPEPLARALDADASRPLTAGYQLLAKQLYGATIFRTWLTLK
jgi:glucose uptake protein GlcU